MSEERFADVEGWKGKKVGGLSFNQIVLMHLNRCIVNGSVEFRGGYNNSKKTIQANSVIEELIYMPDSRAVYANSVRQLFTLLKGYFDKDMDTAAKEIAEELVRFEYENKPKPDAEGKILKADLEKYGTEAVEYSILMLEALVMLLKRLNFFEESSEEIVA